MRVAARRDRLYATHLRSEGNELLEALGETIDCAREAGLRRLHISHFKTAGAANWEKLDAALELLEEAQKGGIAVTVDRYPYTESMTQLSVILPGKAGRSRRLRAFAAAAQHGGARKARSGARRLPPRRLLENRHARLDPEFRRTKPRRADHRGARGTRRQDAAEFAVELLAEDAAGTTAAFRGMSPENMRPDSRSARSA